MPAKVRRVDPSLLNYKHTKSFRLPSLSRSTTDDWAAMAGYVTGLLADNYSLAVANGYDIDSATVGEPAVEELLTPREKSIYSAYKKKPNLPSADWKKLRASIGGAPSQRRRWQAFVVPLSILYKEKVSPENAKAFMEKYKDLVPLLVAVRKVETCRKDGRAAKSGGTPRKQFHELIACRRLMQEIGAQRIKSSSEQKQANKASDQRESELIKRLSKIDRAGAPSDRGEADKIHEARTTASKKLAKTRAARIADSTALKRQNVELTLLEAMLRARIVALEDRLEKEAKGSSSGSGSGSKSKSKK